MGFSEDSGLRRILKVTNTNWRKNYLRWMTGAKDWKMTVALDGEQIAASCSSWYVNDEAGTTEEIFTKQGYRKRGISSAVIRTNLKYLRELGYKKAVLGCFGDNKPAISLYKSLGYKVDGTIQELILGI